MWFLSILYEYFEYKRLFNLSIERACYISTFKLHKYALRVSEFSSRES